ncbi:uncharacterized protein LOC130664581 [Microplitis mediator]|uniref:uncharacterized protein LOC130664581 n=1 Tax=Microplitis mediator TaxID=375433 RepID=UPI00255514E2|nr:uncharacterized protein LOC130664581 [Microplitis mediator]
MANYTIESFKNKEFISYDELDSFMARYEQDEKQKLIKRNRIALTEYDEADAEARASLQYKTIRYVCKFGKDNHERQSTGVRKTSSFKHGCPFFIQVNKPKKKQILHVTTHHLEHNHPGTEEFIDHIPENRRLNNDEKKTVLDLIKMKCDKQSIQKKIVEEYGKPTIKKDLHNLAQKLCHADDDTLAAAKNLLENQYHARVELAVDDINQFRGLYFSTAEMRQDMAKYHDIVFIDGTYNLFKRGYTLMLIVVEDSYLETKVVGVGILANEQRDTLTWFLQCFKNDNIEASSLIKCFMTDKDLTERRVISDLFPGIPTLLCLFHTLRTFGRKVTVQEMEISASERITSLNFLEKLAKSSSAENYDKIYEEFKKAVPLQVLEYFNQNWHPIRAEWTAYSMKYGNLGNTTNNRLESLNSKIKNKLLRHKSLVNFINNFFELILSRQHESNHKRANEFLKINTSKSFLTVDEENKFRSYLSEPVFEKVLNEIQKYSSIEWIKIDSQTKEYSFLFENNEINVNQYQCECLFRTSMMLPCRHIIAVRKLDGLELFDLSLIDKRWTDGVVTKINNVSHHESTPTKQNSTHNSISRIVTPKKLSVSQKQSKLKDIANDIVYSASKSTPRMYEHTLKVLQNLQIDVRQNTCSAIYDRDHEVSDLADCYSQESDVDPSHLTSKASTLQSNADISLTSINLPSPIKIIGRQSIRSNNIIIKKKK